MEEDLRSLILGATGAPERVFYVVRQQGSSLPAVVLTRISAVPSYTMEGPDGLIRSRVQVDAFDTTWLGAKTVLRTVSNIVNGASGVVGDTDFQLIQIDGERDFYDAGSNDAEKIFRISMDLMIIHRSA